MRGRRLVWAALLLMALGALVIVLLDDDAAADPGAAVVPAARTEGGQPALTALAPEAAGELQAMTVAVGEAVIPSVERVGASTSDPVGTIEGHVLTANGFAVPFGTVTAKGLTGEEEVLAAEIREDGSFTFDDVSVGPYQLLVDGESLPDGIHPPRKQEQLIPGTFTHNMTVHDPNRRHGAPRHMFGTGVLVEEGLTARTVLHCYRMSVVEGHVYDQNTGLPASGVQVRLLSLVRKGHVSQDIITGEDGFYRFDDVAPGFYRIQVFMAPDHPLRATAERYPWTELPQIVEADYYRRDVFIGGGTAEISGTLVDDAGEPYDDVRVLVYYASGREQTPDGILLEGSTGNDVNGRTRTDADGRFVADRLYPGSVRVQFIPKLPGRNSMGHHPYQYAPPIDVELSAGQAVDLGTIEVTRSRPFFLHGTIVLDEEWLAEHGVRDSDVLLSITRPAGAPEPDRGQGLVWVPRKDIRVERLEAAEPPDGFVADGHLVKGFTWSCETPYPYGHVEVTLSFEKRRRYDPIPPVRLIVVPREGEESIVLAPST